MNGIVLALLFGAGWLPLYAFRVEAIGEALPCYSRNERLAIWSSLIALVGHITTTCVLLSLTPVVPIWRAATALAVFATGIAFWLWARALIGPLRVRRLPPDAPTLLRRAGPFGLVRNPMYLGVLVATWASTLAAGRAWLALSYAAVVVAVAVRAVQEERRLHEHLGDAYAEYSRAVKRLIPFVW